MNINNNNNNIPISNSTIQNSIPNNNNNNNNINQMNNNNPTEDVDRPITPIGMLTPVVCYHILFVYTIYYILDSNMKQKTIQKISITLIMKLISNI